MAVAVLGIVGLSSCGPGPGVAHDGQGRVTTGALALPETPTTTSADDGSLEHFVPSTASIWWAVVDGSLSPQTVVVRTVDRGRHWQEVTPPIDGPNEAGGSVFVLKF